MSGHSKWATIHRQKGIKDAARGQVFSKLARAITIAAKVGGPDPASNFRLRIVIDKARSLNMPKENIERAISKASTEGELSDIVYEGYGPLGVNVMVEVATDNRNRTSAEIKSLFERSGGKLGGPGSVSFNFEPKGFILIKLPQNSDEAILKLIDLGVEDVEKRDDGIEVFVSPSNLPAISQKIKEDLGLEIISTELIQKSKVLQEIADLEKQKVISFLEGLENHDDVQKVFTNASL